MKKLTITLFSLLMIFAVQAQSSQNSAADASVYNADPTNSSVNWIGKKVTSSHEGTIGISAANFIVRNNELIGGYVIIDMTTIKNTDLGEKGQAKLEGHLSSADFFNVEEHPEAMLTVTEVNAIEGDDANYQVNGNLTIKGITHPTEFSVMSLMNDNGDLSVTGTLIFDRSLYEVKYGSGKFFKDLGNKIIYDDITLSFDVNSTK